MAQKLNRSRRPRRRALSVKLPHLFIHEWEEKFEALIAERSPHPHACYPNFACWLGAQITEGQRMDSGSFEALLHAVARISYNDGFRDGLRHREQPSEKLSPSDCPPARVEEPGESADRQTTGLGVTTAGAGQPEART